MNYDYIHLLFEDDTLQCLASERVYALSLIAHAVIPLDRLKT